MSDDAPHVDLAKPVLQVAIDALRWRQMPEDQIAEALVSLVIGALADVYGHEKAIAMTIKTLRLMFQDLYEARAEAAAAPLQ